MKQEHRKAVAGFKLSILDQLKAGEFHPSINIYMILWLVEKIEELDRELEFAQKQTGESKGDNMKDKIYKITLENSTEKLIKAHYYRRNDNDSLDLFIETEDHGRITVSSFAVGQWRYIETVTDEAICGEAGIIINNAIAKIIEVQDAAIRRILDRCNIRPEAEEMNIDFADSEKYQVTSLGRWEYHPKYEYLG